MESADQASHVRYPSNLGGDAAQETGQVTHSKRRSVAAKCLPIAHTNKKSVASKEQVLPVAGAQPLGLAWHGRLECEEEDANQDGGRALEEEEPTP